MGDIEDRTCRICLEDELSRDEVIAPCQCAGSSKWVHRECLDRWRTTREDKAFSRCTECLAEYTMMNLNEEDVSEDVRRARKKSYYYHVAKDFSGVFMLSQSVIALVAYIAFCADKGHLMNEAKMDTHPKVFYYLFGLGICSMVVGLCAMFYLCTEGRHGHYNSRNPDCGYIYLGASGGDDVCCCCRCGNCGHCGNAAACECGECSGAGASAECAPFLLVVAAGLAVVGLIVTVVAGVVFFQRVLQRHMHILQKQELVKEYVVKDLASKDGGVGILKASSKGGSGGGIGTAADNPNARYIHNPGGDLELGLTGGASSGGATVMSELHPPSAPYYHEVNRVDEELDSSLSDSRLELSSTGRGLLSESGPSASAPPLSVAQRRELSDLGLL